MVQVRDFPFLPHLATGRFSTIDVAATDATAKGDQRRPAPAHPPRRPGAAEVLLGEPGRIAVDRADGTIELTEAEVNRLLADRLQGGSLAIEEDGVGVRVEVPLLGQSWTLVTGRLGARDGGVAFTPRRSSWAARALQPGLEDQLSSQFSFQVPLPELPAGVRLGRSRPGRGRWC